MSDENVQTVAQPKKLNPKRGGAKRRSAARRKRLPLVVAGPNRFMASAIDWSEEFRTSVIQQPPPAPQKSFFEILGDAIKQVAPIVYEGLWKEHSPDSYKAFKTFSALEPHLLPQSKPILDVFVGLAAFKGAADIGIAAGRSLNVSNPPYVKRAN